MSLIKFKDRLPNVNWVELSEYKDLVCSYRCFLDKLISFACVSSKTHLQAVFSYLVHKLKSWFQGFLAETVETGNKNHCVD